jgi:hypothetical protein
MEKRPNKSCRHGHVTKYIQNRFGPLGGGVDCGGKSYQLFIDCLLVLPPGLQYPSFIFLLQMV